MAALLRDGHRGRLPEVQETPFLNTKNYKVQETPLLNMKNNKVQETPLLKTKNNDDMQYNGSKYPQIIIKQAI